MAGLAKDLTLEFQQQIVIDIQDRKVGLDGACHKRIAESLCDVAAVAAVLDAFGESREVVLGVGVLNVLARIREAESRELGLLVHEILPASQQISGCSHVGWVHIGLGEHAGAQQHGDLSRVDLVVLGLCPMDRSHVQGVAKDEGNATSCAEVCDPVPGKYALAGDHEIGTGKSRERLFQLLGSSWEIAVKQDLSSGVQDAQVHLSCVQVDPAIELVVLSVVSHRLPPLVGIVVAVFYRTSSGGGLNEYPISPVDTARNGLIRDNGNRCSTG